MAATVDKVLLVPRFTALVGDVPFLTVPMNVRAYCQAEITAWRSVGMGLAPGTGYVYVQESPDLGNWTDMGAPIEPDGGSDQTATKLLRFDWLRLRLEVAALPASMTFWVVGNFVRRRS